MTIPQIARVGFMIIGVLFASCVPPEESVEDTNTLRPKANSNVNVNVANIDSNSNANVAEDDPAKLKDLINLPFEPKFNNYRLENVPAKANESGESLPAFRKLTVVLQFSEEDTEKLVSQISGVKPPFETEIGSETWFPVELVAKSDTSAYGSLSGTGYAVGKFAKPPFTVGSLVRVKDTDYFVLTLRTQ